MAVWHPAPCWYPHVAKQQWKREETESCPCMERKQKGKTSGSSLKPSGFGISLPTHSHGFEQTMLVVFKDGPSVVWGGMAGNDTQSEVRDTHKVWNSFYLCLHKLFGTFKCLFCCNKTLKNGIYFFRILFFSKNFLTT